MKTLLLAAALFHHGDTAMRISKHHFKFMGREITPDTLTLIIDSVMVRENKNQVFYYAKDLRGIGYDWVVERGLKKKSK